MTGVERLYLRRRGRATPAQLRALTEHYDDYCIDAGTAVDWTKSFGRNAPLAIEIGFGMGDALVDMATRQPQWNCVGIDVYRPGIGALVNVAEQRGLDNVRVVEGDARLSLATQFAAATLQQINVFFPDPWPKKKHHKRRLVTPEFIDLAVSRLVPGGRLLLATDWQAYSAVMLTVLEAAPGIRNLAGPGNFASKPPERGETRFEARGKALGHDVWDLAFERQL
jgi:tRNA (guanine-N7-)-methyltransferase